MTLILLLWATQHSGLVFEMSLRPESEKGFVPIAKRRVAENLILDKRIAPFSER